MLIAPNSKKTLHNHISHHDPPKLPIRRPQPGCMCGKPLMIVIQPGEHIHPCPIHPEYTVYGRQIYWM